jgi:GNAT superfamily N-acetyltransferase
VQIDRIDPATVTDTELAGVHALLAAAAKVDRPRDPAPQPEDVATRLREPDRRDRRIVYLVARTSAGPAGWASLWLSMLDNLRMGLVDVQVHPDSRRRGVGSALLRAMATELAAGGRNILLAETDAGGPGDAFARVVGMRVVEVDRQSLLRLADVDWAAVEVAAAAAHPGYRLVPVTGRIPDDLIGSYATAKSAMNDAPHGETDLEAFEFDVDRVRAEEAAMLRRGEIRVTFAVHEATGAVAGFTETGVGRAPERAAQLDTAVVPTHRGSGLGLWIKAEMLQRLLAERPEVTEVLTGNAASNRHMLAINDRLGFRPWREINGWQADVGQVLTRLG